MQLRRNLRRDWISRATSRNWILGILFGFLLTFILFSSEGVAGKVAPRARGSHDPSESMSSIAPQARTGEGLSDVAFGSGGQRPSEFSALSQDSFRMSALTRRLSPDLRSWVPGPVDTLLFQIQGLVLRDTQPGLEQPLISDGQFVWGPNVGSFDIRDFLDARNSPLADYADDIARWANFSSVNPQVLLVVLELRDGLVSSESASADPGEIIERTALELASYFYEHLHFWGARRPPDLKTPTSGPALLFADGTIAVLPADMTSGTAALIATLASDSDPESLARQVSPGGVPGSFSGVFGEYFPGTDLLDPSNNINPLAPPPDTLFQLPYPMGATWTASGPHSWNGGSYPPPFSSLDFFAAGGTCGAPPNLYSVSAAYGSAYRPYGYSCWLEINHGDGWVTSYYHLQNLYSGPAIGRNSKVGTIACETCAGGFATGPHVHFSLKYNGAYASLEGVKLSGWTVHVGSVPYTGGWYERDGTILTPYTQITNDYETYYPGPETALRFNGNGLLDVDRVKIRMTDTSLGAPADVGNADMTIEWWMRAFSSENNAGDVACGANDSWREGNILLDRDRADQDQDYGVSIAGGKLVFGVGGDGTGEISLCGSRLVADGAWHHVAVQRRRSDGWMWIYIDGVLDVEADGPDGDISYPEGAVPSETCNGPCINDPYLVIGGEKHGIDPALLSFNGWIDEMRLSNILRYSSNFSPAAIQFSVDPSTVALYHFNDSSGNTAYDVSGYLGGPSNGSLKIGGAPEGPQWVASDAFLTFRLYFPFFPKNP